MTITADSKKLRTCSGRSSGADALELRSLSKRYPNGVLALDQVSFRVKEGEFVYLLGPSGAGKTTLLRCIHLLERATSGDIVFLGRSAQGLSRREARKRRRMMGMIFQQNGLIPQLSALQNVLLGRIGYQNLLQRLTGSFSAADEERAAALLKQLGLSRYIRTRAENLSVGQQQRVNIARALMQEPRLLLCDEPLSALDPYHAREVLETISQAAGERRIACLMGLHQVDLAMERPARTILLKDGRLSGDRTPGGLSEEDLHALYQKA